MYLGPLSEDQPLAGHLAKARRKYEELSACMVDHDCSLENSLSPEEYDELDAELEAAAEEVYWWDMASCSAVRLDLYTRSGPSPVIEYITYLAILLFFVALIMLGLGVALGR